MKYWYDHFTIGGWVKFDPDKATLLLDGEFKLYKTVKGHYVEVGQGYCVLLEPERALDRLTGREAAHVTEAGEQEKRALLDSLATEL